MAKQNEELAWRVGGPQGSGVDTAAGIFQRACAIGGLYVFGRREYYSNIKGRHSYYDVRIAHHPVLCHRESVDLLTTFEPESLARHALAVVPGGAIIFHSKDADVPLTRLVYLEDRARQYLETYLEEKGLPKTTAGLLEDARQRGVQIYPIPYTEMTTELGKRLGVPRAIADRTLNTLAVAVSAALLEFPADYVVKAIERTWPGRQKIIDMNAEAVRLAYEFVREQLNTEHFEFRMDIEGEHPPRLLLNGNQAVALGKLAGGMTFQSYYPISPATDESFYLEANSTFPLRNGKDGGVVVVQTEDEIAAIGMSIGAALTGARAATATSGPGFSLMVEALGWAGTNEVPVVITLYMRGGPSTGMPTRTDQGDLWFAIHAGHGEFPRIVLASGSLEEAFYDAAQAFNYAEKFQMPVIHLVDKAMASFTQTVPMFDLSRVKIERGLLYTPPPSTNGNTKPFPRFQPTETGISPRPFVGQPGAVHWYTGVEHTVEGRVNEDPVVREMMMEKRARKMDVVRQEIPVEEKIQIYGDPNAALTIITWGSNKGAILDAMERLEKEGVAARLIQVRLMWPFPGEELLPYLESAQPLVMVEANFSGQLAQILKMETGHTVDHLIVKYSGRPFSGEALYNVLKTIIAGNAEPRIVVRNPME